MSDDRFTMIAKVGKWEVFIDPVALSGYFEHDDFGEGGGLWFEVSSTDENGKPTLGITDYDGRAVLPKDVCTAMLNLGVVMTPDFFPDNFTPPRTQEHTIQVTLKIKSGNTLSDEAVQKWVTACLNCNVNNIEAEVILK